MQCILSGNTKETIALVQATKEYGSDSGNNVKEGTENK